MLKPRVMFNGTIGFLICENSEATLFQAIERMDLERLAVDIQTALRMADIKDRCGKNNHQWDLRVMTCSLCGVGVKVPRCGGCGGKISNLHPSGNYLRHTRGECDDCKLTTFFNMEADNGT